MLGRLSTWAPAHGVDLVATLAAADLGDVDDPDSDAGGGWRVRHTAAAAAAQARLTARVRRGQQPHRPGGARRLRDAPGDGGAGHPRRAPRPAGGRAATARRSAGCSTRAWTRARVVQVGLADWANSRATQTRRRPGACTRSRRRAGRAARDRSRMTEALALAGAVPAVRSSSTSTSTSATAPWPPAARRACRGASPPASCWRAAHLAGRHPARRRDRPDRGRRHRRPRRPHGPARRDGPARGRRRAGAAVTRTVTATGDRPDRARGAARDRAARRHRRPGRARRRAVLGRRGRPTTAPPVLARFDGPPRPAAVGSGPGRPCPVSLDLQPGPGRLPAGVRRLREEIAAGQVYQANLCRVLSAQPARDPAWRRSHAALAAGNPAPYAALVDVPGAQVVRPRPELFLRRDGRRVSSGPIKGTGAHAADLREQGRRGERDDRRPGPPRPVRDGRRPAA